MSQQHSQAEALLKLGRLDEAEAHYEAQCLNTPDDPVGFAGLARTATRRGDWDLAARRWTACIDRFPNQVRPWWRAGLGQALTKLGRWDDALSVYETLCQEHPGFPGGHVGLAQLAAFRSQWYEAAVLWEYCRATFADAEEPWWCFGEADALLNLARFADARDRLRQLTAKWPDSPLGPEGLARTALLAGDPQAALDLATSLIERHPSRPAGYRWAEEALIALGRFEEAGHVKLSAPSQQPPAVLQPPHPGNVPPDLVLPPIKGEGNDYSFIEHSVRRFVEAGSPYHLPVSVIIPAFDGAALLSKTLAALTHQTYPRTLIEVVVTGRNSERLDAVAKEYDRCFRITSVQQENLDRRAAAARNLGMRAASHQHFIFLDADVLPAPTLVEAYMKYFHVTDQAVLLGLRQDVLATASELTSHRYPFMAMSGGHFAVANSAIDGAGSFDEEFDGCGGEDQELGFRLYNAGLYFIPIHDAMGLHQAPPGGRNDIDRQARTAASRALLERKIPALRTSIGTKDRIDIRATPKVSIYVPAHNAERFITLAIDSVLAQSFTDLEVVICDDGSTDRTVQLLEAHYGGDARVRWLSQPHRGISAASNTAVRLCRGMYIGQLDADDVLRPGAIEQAVALLDRSGAGVVYGGTELIDEHGMSRRVLVTQPFSRERMLESMIVWPFRMFRKRDWMRTAGFDETLSSAVDHDMFQKLSEVCSFLQLSGVTYGYRFHGSNTSLVGRREQEANHRESTARALRRMGLAQEWTVVPAIHEGRHFRIERRSLTPRCAG